MRITASLLSLTLLTIFTANANAADFIVTSNAGDGPGSLMNAIVQANATPGHDAVLFNIPSGNMDIYLTTNTLDIDDPITIDGTSQPGYTTGPLIAVSTAPPILLPGVSPVIRLLAGSDNSIIRGLEFRPPENSLLPISGNTVAIVQPDNIILDDCRFNGLDAMPSMFTNSGLRIAACSGVTLYHCQFGNLGEAIRVASSEGVLISDCAIGIDFDGTPTPCFSSGINILSNSPGAPTGTEIGPLFGDDANTIANCSDGIFTLLSDVQISQNRIFNITNTPINTPNPGIVNNLHGKRHDGRIKVTGELGYGDQNHYYRIQFFADYANVDPAKVQARWYIGETIVHQMTPSVAPNFTADFIDNLPPTPDLAIRATVTDMATGDTSKLTIPGDIERLTISTDAAPGSNQNWIPSGIDSGPEYTLNPSTPDDVDVLRGSESLFVIVQPSVGRYRIAGWQNPAITNLAEVPPDSIIRGKFYVYASNPRTDPVNKVPNFRLRLNNENAVLATINYEYARTGSGGLAREPFYELANDANAEAKAGISLRPSGTAALPSLYRIDMLTPDVPASAGSNIGASFESFSTQNTANGTLALAGLTLAVYPKSAINFSTSTTLEYHYQTYDGWPNATPPNEPWVSVSVGQFNAENNFEPGRLQTLDVAGEVPASQLSMVFETPGDGEFIDTSNVPDDKFGAGILTFNSTDHTKTPRLEYGLYFAHFTVVSDMPTSSALGSDIVQGGMSFQIQTAGGCVTSRLELPGPVESETVNTTTSRILAEVLPGQGCQLFTPASAYFPAGTRGGVYTVLLPSPMSPDILRDIPVALNSSPGIAQRDADPSFALFNQPGYGQAVPSVRDITIGVNAITAPTTLILTPSVTITGAQPNDTKINILSATLGSMPDIDDGGYLQ